jgi:hypothetical protein
MAVHVDVLETPHQEAPFPEFMIQAWLEDYTKAG